MTTLTPAQFLTGLADSVEDGTCPILTVRVVDGQVKVSEWLRAVALALPFDDDDDPEE